MPAETAGGRHGCPACPQRFPTVGDKKRHLREDHDKKDRDARPAR